MHLLRVTNRHPMVGDVRGEGLLLALGLVRGRATKEQVPPAVGRELMLAMARREVLVAGGGPDVRLTPLCLALPWWLGKRRGVDRPPPQQYDQA